MQWLTELRINGLERALGGLDWLARKRGREQSLPAHLLTGIEGEEAAYFHLRRKNYVVVARRWSGGNLPGDIDLIAWQGQLLCFIEVKTRTARDRSPAEIAVDSHKRHVLRRLARQLDIDPLSSACMVDDTPDLPIMSAVGFAAAVAGAHP